MSKLAWWKTDGGDDGKWSITIHPRQETLFRVISTSADFLPITCPSIFVDRAQKNNKKFDG